MVFVVLIGVIRKGCFMNAGYFGFRYLDSIFGGYEESTK